MFDGKAFMAKTKRMLDKAGNRVRSQSLRSEGSDSGTYSDRGSGKRHSGTGTVSPKAVSPSNSHTGRTTTVGSVVDGRYRSARELSGFDSDRRNDLDEGNDMPGVGEEEDVAVDVDGSRGHTESGRFNLKRGPQGDGGGGGGGGGSTKKTMGKLMKRLMEPMPTALNVNGGSGGVGGSGGYSEEQSRRRDGSRSKGSTNASGYTKVPRPLRSVPEQGPAGGGNEFLQAVAPYNTNEGPYDAAEGQEGAAYGVQGRPAYQGGFGGYANTSNGAPVQRTYGDARTDYTPGAVYDERAGGENLYGGSAATQQQPQHQQIQSRRGSRRSGDQDGRNADVSSFYQTGEGKNGGRLGDESTFALRSFVMDNDGEPEGGDRGGVAGAMGSMMLLASNDTDQAGTAIGGQSEYGANASTQEANFRDRNAPSSAFFAPSFFYGNSSRDDNDDAEEEEETDARHQSDDSDNEAEVPQNEQQGSPKSDEGASKRERRLSKETQDYEYGFDANADNDSTPMGNAEGNGEGTHSNGNKGNSRYFGELNEEALKGLEGSRHSEQRGHGSGSMNGSQYSIGATGLPPPAQPFRWVPRNYGAYQQRNFFFGNGATATAAYNTKNGLVRAGATGTTQGYSSNHNNTGVSRENQNGDSTEQQQQQQQQQQHPFVVAAQQRNKLQEHQEHAGEQIGRQQETSTDLQGEDKHAANSANTAADYESYFDYITAQQQQQRRGESPSNRSNANDNGTRRTTSFAESDGDGYGEDVAREFEELFLMSAPSAHANANAEEVTPQSVPKVKAAEHKANTSQALRQHEGEEGTSFSRTLNSFYGPVGKDGKAASERRRRILEDLIRRENDATRRGALAAFEKEKLETFQLIASSTFWCDESILKDAAFVEEPNLTELDSAPFEDAAPSAVNVLVDAAAHGGRAGNVSQRMSIEDQYGFDLSFGRGGSFGPMTSGRQNSGQAGAFHANDHATSVQKIVAAAAARPARQTPLTPMKPDEGGARRARKMVASTANPNSQDTKLAAHGSQSPVFTPTHGSPRGRDMDMSESPTANPMSAIASPAGSPFATRSGAARNRSISTATPTASDRNMLNQKNDATRHVTASSPSANFSSIDLAEGTAGDSFKGVGWGYRYGGAYGTPMPEGTSSSTTPTTTTPSTTGAVAVRKQSGKGNGNTGPSARTLGGVTPVAAAHSGPRAAASPATGASPNRTADEGHGENRRRQTANASDSESESDSDSDGSSSESGSESDSSSASSSSATGALGDFSALTGPRPKDNGSPRGQASGTGGARAAKGLSNNRSVSLGMSAVAGYMEDSVFGGGGGGGSSSKDPSRRPSHATRGAVAPAAPSPGASVSAGAKGPSVLGPQGTKPVGKNSNASTATPGGMRDLGEYDLFPMSTRSPNPTAATLTTKTPAPLRASLRRISGAAPSPSATHRKPSTTLEDNYSMYGSLSDIMDNLTAPASNTRPSASNDKERRGSRGTPASSTPGRSGSVKAASSPSTATTTATSPFNNRERTGSTSALGPLVPLKSVSGSRPAYRRASLANSRHAVASTSVSGSALVLPPIIGYGVSPSYNTESRHSPRTATAAATAAAGAGATGFAPPANGSPKPTESPVPTAFTPFIASVSPTHASTGSHTKLEKTKREGVGSNTGSQAVMSTGPRTTTRPV